MWVLLPLLSIFITTDLLANKHSYFLRNHRLAFIATLLFHAAFVFISTEILSLFNCINSVSVIILWILIVVFLLIYKFKTGDLKNTRVKTNIKKYFGENKIFAFATVFITAISLITCLVAYPNTWDSMTYHLPRVMHWIQNCNVNHYPTHNDRQLGLSPLAEYCILHIKLLSPYDPFVNLVQWMAMAGSVLVTSLIAKECGGKKREQILAAFFTAAIPMGILQSNSTQNDYFVGFFIVCSVLFLIKTIKYHFLLNDSVLFILCCCLAVVAKGTAFVYLIPVVIIWSGGIIAVLKIKFIKQAIIGIVLVIIFCLPQFVRNSHTFRHPLGADYGLSNESYGIAPTLSNMSKNAAIHLKTPFPKLNNGIETSVISVNQFLHININSPKYNWRFTPPFEVAYLSTQEDSAGNFLHVLLFIVCFVIFIFHKKLRQNKIMLIVLSIGILMFISFCTLLKWQIWNCRLMLPMFIVITPFLAYIVNAIYSKKILFGLVFLFFCSSCLFLFVNQSRMWFGKDSIFTNSATDQYFENNDKWKIPFVEISDKIKMDNLKNIGFYTSGDAWLYPFWVLLKENDITVQQVMVENDSKIFSEKEPFRSFVPDVIISNKLLEEDPKILRYKNIDYHIVYQNEQWTLLKKTL